jgi:hypothetical protein
MPRRQRVRRTYSVTRELLTKSREAALAAVQLFNNPQITFKFETFIVLMIIAWTYLLHAYYRQNGVEYRYFTKPNQRRKFDKTKSGAHKHWELERCLNCAKSPVDSATASNLKFLIGLRHEIEHQMTTRLDHALSAKFQACCLNYNKYLQQLFGEAHGIDRHLSFSLQFSSISAEHAKELSRSIGLPRHIQLYIDSFESGLSQQEFDDPRYAYRLLFVPKTANRKGQADEVIEFVRADSELAEGVNKTYALVKETERPKHLPSGIVRKMHGEGYTGFTIPRHTDLWKSLNAKDPSKGWGVQIQRQWYWYENWIDRVRQHCKEHAYEYRRLEG